VPYTMLMRVRLHRCVSLGGSGRLISVMGTRSGDGTTRVVVGTPYGRACSYTTPHLTDSGGVTAW
jgi:hypothetical protein